MTRSPTDFTELLLDLVFDLIEFCRRQVDETSAGSGAAHEDGRADRFAADSPEIEIAGVCGDDAQSDVCNLVVLRPAD